MACEPVNLEKDPEFIAIYTKAKVVEDILAAMEEAGMNKNDLAKALGKSRQYVGAILNETANFTIETMAAISCAAGRRLAIRMIRADECLEVVSASPAKSIQKAKPSVSPNRSVRNRIKPQPFGT